MDDDLLDVQIVNKSATAISVTVQQILGPITMNIIFHPQSTETILLEPAAYKIDAEPLAQRAMSRTWALTIDQDKYIELTAFESPAGISVSMYIAPGKFSRAKPYPCTLQTNQALRDADGVQRRPYQSLANLGVAAILQSITKFTD
jgi:hypothetical protein